jgi:hypothetical protein
MCAPLASWQAVQSTQPLTPFPISNGRVGYFEVRIDSTGTSGFVTLALMQLLRQEWPTLHFLSLSRRMTPRNRNIGVGLCMKDYPKRKAQPGWRQSSYGWHGDDGRLVRFKHADRATLPPIVLTYTCAFESVAVLAEHTDWAGLGGMSHLGTGRHRGLRYRLPHQRHLLHAQWTVLGFVPPLCVVSCRVVSCRVVSCRVVSCV